MAKVLTHLTPASRGSQRRRDFLTANTTAHHKSYSPACLCELCMVFYTAHTGGVVKKLKWREKWDGQPYKMVCLRDIFSVIGQRYRNKLLLVRRKERMDPIGGKEV